MQTLISTAHIIICGGGGTLIEAARSGTPAIAIEMADNQRNNIKAWTKLGFARYAGEKNSLKLGFNVLRYITELNNHDTWKEASQIGAANVDGQGARRIAKIMIRETKEVFKVALLKNNYNFCGLYLKNFLHSTPSELEMIRNARNTPVVRTGSINQQIITLNNHQAFILNLGTSTTGGYWLAYSDETPVGVVSLTETDWRHSHTTLGYYKLPGCPHKGIGKVLVSAAKELTFNALGLKTLRAECLKDNIASIKSMEAVGLRNIGSEARHICSKPLLILKFEVNKS